MRLPLLAGLALALVTGGANAPMPAAVRPACDDDPALLVADVHEPGVARLASGCAATSMAFADRWLLAVDAPPPGASIGTVTEGLPPWGGEADRDREAAAVLGRDFAVSPVAALNGPMLLDAPWLLAEAGVRPTPVPATVAPVACAGECAASPTTPRSVPARHPVPEPPVLALLLPGLAMAGGKLATGWRPH